MSKRRLPNSIRPPGADDPKPASAPPAQYEAPVPAPGAGRERDAAASDKAVEVLERAPSVSPAHDPAAAPDDAAVSPEAAARRSRARTTVENHSAGSAAGGIIPLPIANLATLTALNVHLVKRLCEIYEVPYERERARVVVIGLLGGIMPGGLGMITASTLGWLIPASGLIGLAVSSVSAYACTQGIGKTLIRHFESGKTLHEIPLIEWP
jgi:uncharacterized protein (DUF697 family)